MRHVHLAHLGHGGVQGIGQGGVHVLPGSQEERGPFCRGGLGVANWVTAERVKVVEVLRIIFTCNIT